MGAGSAGEPREGSPQALTPAAAASPPTQEGAGQGDTSLQGHPPNPIGAQLPFLPEERLHSEHFTRKGARGGCPGERRSGRGLEAGRGLGAAGGGRSRGSARGGLTSPRAASVRSPP